MILALLLALQDPEGVAFFEKKIRPILVERCYECHSAQAKRLKGSLYLDTREGTLKGGDVGPAVVPGHPEKSLLLKALTWEDEDLKMPPKQKLPPELVADVKAWIQRGAPDPRTAKAAVVKKSGMTLEEARSFWSYKPLATAPAPAVKDAAWAASDIDRHVLAGLEAKGLAPAPAADRATLLRRLHYDLAGLPPTPEEVDAFVKDPAPDAVEKVVDALLASPRFGERWGRHWLDVARFAESLTLRGFIFKEAWRYRDYVIAAFNADVPFDRFLREQVAGDLLGGATIDERRRRMTATTFLALGNSNLEEQDKKQLEMDVVDEQLDTLGRAVLAQTLGCARCHDHKFDPIPTADYYAMAGILKNSRMLEHANVSKWIEAPLPMDASREAEAKKHEQAIAAVQAKIKAERARTAPKDKPDAPATVLAVADVPGVAVDDAKAEKVGEWIASTHTGRYIGAGYLHDKNEKKGEKSLTFHPELAAGLYEVRLAYSHGASRATNVPVTILSAEGERDVTVNQQEQPPIEGRYVSLGQYRFENNQGYVIVSNEGTKGHVTADAVVFLPAGKTEAAKTAAATSTIKELEAELKRLEAAGSRRDMVMALREEPKIADLRIHHRGNVQTQGDVVPRGVLRAATPGAAPAMPKDQSGRVQLADWLVAKENPLTARVYVNRAWHWLFGAGIVRTPDNFGVTGEKPSHPALLDHLAASFVEDGWSVKKLVRRLVLSSAYRMASTPSASALELDPENRLFSRANRRRLDAESLRDTLLGAGGRLQLDGGGPSFPASLSSDYGYKADDVRRSVYVPVFRNALPEIFEAFDFADTSVSTGRRESSTVAPQALFLLNSPFVIAQANHAAARLLAETHADDRARVVRAWRLAIGRAPTSSETDIALRFLASGKDVKQAWATLIQSLFASIEFRYVN